MAVPKKPNTKTNFGRTTRLLNRVLTVLCAARIILIMKNRTDLFASAFLQTWGDRPICLTASAPYYYRG
jgi:hypothetical protein